MGISSSALASLVIAGTAIGGSTFAVMANTASSDINSSKISQIADTDPSAKLPGESVTQVDENGNPQTITQVNPGESMTPNPTSNYKKIAPTVPPVDFGGNGDDDSDYGDGNDDSYQGSDDGESEDDSNYGNNGYEEDEDDD